MHPLRLVTWPTRAVSKTNSIAFLVQYTDAIAEGGRATEGTSISGGDQATNMQTGSADHLDLGFRKS